MILAKIFAKIFAWIFRDSQWYEDFTEVLIQGCHRSGNGEGKYKFLKVREKSGNFIFSQGKLAFWRKVMGNWNYKTADLIPLIAGRSISDQCDLSKVFVLEVDTGGRYYMWHFVLILSRRVYFNQGKDGEFWRRMSVATMLTLVVGKSANLWLKSKKIVTMAKPIGSKMN